MEETQQINICIDEMAKLKEKMEALEKQKILNEKNEMLKKTTMEPNLKVLENWLVNYHKANRSVTKNMIDEQEKYIREQIMNERRNGGTRSGSSKIEKLNSALNTSSSYYNKGIPVTYGTLIGDNYNKISYISMQNSRKPTEVMEAHIEATYNMFNIINKRLDDIENKLGIKN